MIKHIYVDYSNLYAEARHLSAVYAGIASSITAAQDERKVAHWRCDLAKFLQHLSADKPGTAFLVTSEPFPDLHLAEWAGFEVRLYPRSYGNREKCVDTHFAIRVVNDALTKLNPKVDEIVLVTGDLDQAPTLHFLKSHGFQVRVVFWNHASRELRNTAHVFESLNPAWDTILCEGPRALKEKR